jgi:hypothetical protein
MADQQFIQVYPRFHVIGRWRGKPAGDPFNEQRDGERTRRNNKLVHVHNDDSMLLCLYTVLSIRAGNQPLNLRKNLRACSAEEFSFCLKKRGEYAACVNVKIK